MRHAFSMIELIFVIVILGILSSAITMALPDHRLLDDTNYILQQIQQKQLRALSYDHTQLGDESWRSQEYNDTCITLTTSAIQTLQTEQRNGKKYKISPQTSLHASVDKICFDAIGRVYQNDYQLKNFLNMPIELNITYKQNTKRFFILPFSGSVIKK